VEVARTGYGAAGTASVHPLDGALNLPPEKYSLEVRRRVAMEAAKSSFDEGTKTLEMYTGAHVPKRQFEELTKRAAQDFQAFYTQRQAGAGADPQTGSIREWSCSPRICANRRSARRRRGPRPSRRGWAVGAASMPNGWPRWLPFIPSNRLCARPRRSCQNLPGSKRACAATAGT
jgi:hypothetical protein